MLSPQYRRDVDLLESVQKRVTKIMQSMEHLPHKNRLRELGLLSLEKDSLRGISSMCVNTWRENVAGPETETQNVKPVYAEGDGL